MLKHFKPFLIAACVIITVFVAVSLLNVIIAVLYIRFSTNAVFVTTFSVGGIFAAVIGFQTGIDYSAQKNETIRWGLILFFITSGLLFLLWFAKMESGEYKAALKGYGITLALGSLLFVKEKL